MSGEPSVTQLIKSMNKFGGTKYIEWQRSTRAIISLTHPGIADIINGVQRPVEIFEDVYEQDPLQPATTAGPSRARTRSQSARVQSSVLPPSSSVGATAEGETPATVDESGPTDQDPPSTQEPRLPRVVPHVSRVANMRDIENWDRCNEQLFNVLYLSTTGPAASYLLRYQPKGSERPNGIRAWEALISKYQNSSKQRIRILMRELNSTSMSPGQDPDTFSQQSVPASGRA